MCGRICNGCDVAVVCAECICVAVYARVVVLHVRPHTQMICNFNQFYELLNKF
jgi:hypothetical protein